MKKIIKKLLLSIVIILILYLLFTIQTNIIFTSKSENTDYSNIMRDNINNLDAKAINIKMLGAHDAFTDKISLSSTVDIAEDESSIAKNKALRYLLNGLIVKLSKAQKSDCTKLLFSGVRYFDVRLSFQNDIWYTKHVFLSAEFNSYLMDILKFLDTNKGEMIILDFQHIYLGDSSMEDLFVYLQSIKYNNKSLLDYLHYNPLLVDLPKLTYGMVTDNKQNSGVIILTKADTSNTLKYHYNYKSSIRSVWHNKNTHKGMLEAIDTEYNDIIKTPSSLNMFRVNQAQMTGKFDLKSILNTLKGRSLLEMANSFNSVIILNENIENYMNAMPILMVDYADSKKGNFNNSANEIMMKLNRLL